MPKRSAGIVLYRRVGGEIELLLVHPGGPFWKTRDLGAWSIPKGEYAPGEDPLAVAMREFEEETGVRPRGEFQPLGEVMQKGGKIVAAWAVEGDLDPATINSNTFEIEWPPKSGRKEIFPEVDRAAWFSPDQARAKILSSQAPFIARLIEMIGLRPLL
ncbi:MAG TPA: NUDIX domain-containing protein [Bryobacteraceae bacterium]|jgi:predicted NUDIX family NTP pyrophosphohydrolase